MGYRSTDQMSPRIYPWWLILVGFIFGVIVTLVVTSARPQPVVVYQQPENRQAIMAQATQMVRYATMTAQAVDSGMARSEMLDPLLATATAIVIQATQQAPPK
ncbi:MAG: hypothetical protein GC204_19545 [Chloroflexi bacterium]|nr:hypothetical protein [Chloroflexota bacterium]